MMMKPSRRRCTCGLATRFREDPKIKGRRPLDLAALLGSPIGTCGEISRLVDLVVLQHDGCFALRLPSPGGHPCPRWRGGVRRACPPRGASVRVSKNAFVVK